MTIYAVMLNFEIKEVFVEVYSAEEYKAAYPFNDERHPTSIFDNEKAALREARRVAKISSGWKYNVARNILKGRG